MTAAISYGCIGRSVNKDKTASANGLETLRFAMHYIPLHTISVTTSYNKNSTTKTNCCQGERIRVEGFQSAGSRGCAALPTNGKRKPHLAPLSQPANSCLFNTVGQLLTW